MGSQGLEGCSTPIGAVSTMRGTEVMESLFSDVSSAAYVGFCFPAHPVTFWGSKARPFYPFPNRSLRTNFGLSVLYKYKEGAELWANCCGGTCLGQGSHRV